VRRKERPQFHSKAIAFSQNSFYFFAHQALFSNWKKVKIGGRGKKFLLREGGKEGAEK